MKIKFDFIVVLIFVVFLTEIHGENTVQLKQNEWGQESSGIALSILPVQSCISPHDHLEMVMYVKNCSDKTIKFCYNRYHPFASADIDIVTSEGKKIPMTKLGTRRMEFPLLSLSFISLAPQNTAPIHFGEPINKLFDMSLDGQYFISLKSHFIITDHLLEAQSLKSKITIDNNLQKIDKALFLKKQDSWSKSQYGVQISIITDKHLYNEYGPIFIKLISKNISKKNLSMKSDVFNVFDAYELTLKTPSLNRDFRKSKHKDDVQDAVLTLYGQKLFSEKSKKPKSMVIVKPDEEVAETVIVLNRIFDMSEDGIYGLIVSRKFIDENGKEQTVTSDPLPIRVGTALTQDEIDQRIKERQEKEKNTKK
jgi:hypothetical protein